MILINDNGHLVKYFKSTAIEGVAAMCNAIKNRCLMLN